ncbi:MAG TPA: hypothetical protein VHW95_02775 [Steroidobacteraceae bacterium]|jgi:hypothetical protein|nr:hypothetical protein [Steroidobacteraceae bacterium]
MLPRFHTVASAAFTFVGLVSALSAPASATELDSAFAAGGSLDVSLEDLALSSGPGATVFFLNAGCAFLFAVYAFLATRPKGRDATRIPFHATSNFAG